jgi:hypothetical protein
MRTALRQLQIVRSLLVAIRRVASDEKRRYPENKSTIVTPSICVFDLNETLLDTEFIAPLFQRLFGDSKVMREWFGQLILYSEAITLLGPYTTFFTLGRGVLQMLGSIPAALHESVVGTKQTYRGEFAHVRFEG